VGLSDAIGPLTFGKREEQNLLEEREISKDADYRRETEVRIDQETTALVAK